ncbi:MAG: MBL fold metallo-hydrolase [bacterium]|nr:MBL fold metallo-hydrolase [bacterium]
MILEQMVVGPLQCNCSILGCEESKEAVIIDPGGDPESIITQVKSLGLKPKFLLHTHAHLDHVGGTKEVQDHCGGEACLHQADQILFDHVPEQAALFNLPTPPTGKIDQYVTEGDSVKFGNYKIQVLHTPGHTPGSLSFLLEGPEGNQLFTGDTLFARGIGRTDLWGGDFNEIMRSIKDKLLLLGDDTTIYPGHGPESTIGTERAQNPFINQL